METAGKSVCQSDGQPLHREFRPDGARPRRSRWQRALVATLLLLTTGAPLLAEAAPTVKHVLVFGDSLSAGYGMSREAAWPSLLDRHLQDNADTRQWAVVNASVSGETTHGGLSRLPGVLARERPAVVVLELGGNDALRGLALVEARNNLERMVQEVRASGARLLLVGIALPPNFGDDYTRDFERMYVEVARRNKVPLLPNLVAALGIGREDFQADGIHPQARVQARLLETVLPMLKPLLK